MQVTRGPSPASRYQGADRGATYTRPSAGGRAPESSGAVPPGPHPPAVEENHPVPTSKQRRQAAQRHLQRQLERRAEQTRRRRRNLLIGVTAIVVLAVAGAVVLIAGIGTGKPDPSAAGASASPTAAAAPPPAPTAWSAATGRRRPPVGRT